MTSIRKAVRCSPWRTPCRWCTTQGRLKPVSEHLLAEPVIIARMANALMHRELVARESNTPGYKAMAVRFVTHVQEETAQLG